MVLDADADRTEPRLAPGLLASAVFHALAATAFLTLPSHFLKSLHDAPQVPLLLGYLGPVHQGSSLDEQSAGLRFSFTQPGQPAASTRPTMHLAPVSRSVLRAEKPTATPRRTSATAARPDGLRPPAELTDASGVPATTGGEDEFVIEPIQELGADVSFSESFVIVKLVKPIYPEEELQKRISARLLVAVHVTAEGSIDEQEVRSAEADPPYSTRAFELTAIEALRQWRIRLPTGKQYQDGTWLTVPIEFEPEEGQINLSPAVAP